MLALATLHAPADTAPSTWTPHRVYDAHHKRFSDFESLAAAVATSDIAFLGEQHDDAGTHRMELALLEAVARRNRPVILSLEMFERDVQPALDAYLDGTMSEAAFLRVSRPWPNYASDYRPLVEFARAHGWRVVAADIPRRMASSVVAGGLAAITGLTDSTRHWAAADFQCDPAGDYFKRFVVAMGSHPMGNGPILPMDNMYRAQCVKDETMAESIASASRDGHGALVIQYNGDFHSDFGEGTVARTRRRLPHARILVISAVPVPSLDTVNPKPSRKQADWIVFTLMAQRAASR
jgi:uncharacterized iron-regulated protein